MQVLIQAVPPPVRVIIMQPSRSLRDFGFLSWFSALLSLAIYLAPQLLLGLFFLVVPKSSPPTPLLFFCFFFLFISKLLPY